MIRLIALNETEYWNITFPVGCKLLSVYAYDDVKATYCCEMTPSRECHFLGTIPTIVPEDDTERGAFLDNVMEGDSQTDYIEYYHCSYVDSLPVIKGVETDDPEEDAMELTEENFRTNRCNYEMNIINLFGGK